MNGTTAGSDRYKMRSALTAGQTNQNRVRSFVYPFQGKSLNRGHGIGDASFTSARLVGEELGHYLRTSGAHRPLCFRSRRRGSLGTEDRRVPEERPTVHPRARDCQFGHKDPRAKTEKDELSNFLPRSSRSRARTASAAGGRLQPQGAAIVGGALVCRQLPQILFTCL